MSSTILRQVRLQATVLAFYGLFIVCGAGTERAVAQEVDPYMGDWKGTWTMAEGTGTGSGPMAAQVIAIGKGKYRLNLLREFDTRTEPIAVLEGQHENIEVRFTGRVQREGAESDVRAVIKDGKLAGSMKGHNSEGKYVSAEFILEKTVRLSPKLGEKPPENAIILFDGKNFDEWEPVHPATKGLVSLINTLGPSEKSVAYLRSALWSDEQQKARLEIGSDDGVKVWLNDQVIHANNAMRALRPGEDKVDITLKKGWNDILLKVTQGSGGWEVCVRLIGLDGEILKNVKEMVNVESSDAGTSEYLQKSDGFLCLWEVSGPYREEGKDGLALFDVAFEPEKPGVRVEGKRVNISELDMSKVRWKLVDGAMEITPGIGSIVTKRRFSDFKLHLEFRTPFMPESEGQARGNSGVYLQGRYEVQILDSYGLEGRDNECGGVYEVGAPLVNMCAPPMQWQSYDITFLAPRFDEAGKKLKDVKLTVVHNGVTIQENLSVPGPTAEAMDNNVTEPGPIYLQDHGNPVQYRNIWLIEMPQ